MHGSTTLRINQHGAPGFPPGLMLLILSLAFALSGCQRTDSQAEQRSGGPPKSFADHITAPEIFSSMVTKYRKAVRYSDRAVLYMSYRLNGRAIQEPQPWTVAIDEKGRFAANLFNAQVRCDGKLLSCYVYDIESGNLDDQRLLLPVHGELPLETALWRQDRKAFHRWLFGDAA